MAGGVPGYDLGVDDHGGMWRGLALSGSWERDGASGSAAWYSEAHRYGDKHEAWSLPEVMSRWMCTERSGGWKDAEQDALMGSTCGNVSCACFLCSFFLCKQLPISSLLMPLLWMFELDAYPDAISLKLDLSLTLRCFGFEWNNAGFYIICSYHVLLWFCLTMSPFWDSLLWKTGTCGCWPPKIYW